jgi:hypothetical protein
MHGAFYTHYYMQFVGAIDSGTPLARHLQYSCVSSAIMITSHVAMQARKGAGNPFTITDSIPEPSWEDSQPGSQQMSNAGGVQFSAKQQSQQLSQQQSQQHSQQGNQQQGSQQQAADSAQWDCDAPMMVVGAMLLDAYQHGHKVDEESFTHFVYKQVSRGGACDSSCLPAVCSNTRQPACCT